MKRMMGWCLAAAMILLGCASAWAAAPLTEESFGMYGGYAPIIQADGTIVIAGNMREKGAAVLAIDSQGKALWQLVADGAMKEQSFYYLAPMPDGAVGAFTVGYRDQAKSMTLIKDGQITGSWPLPQETGSAFGVADGVLVFYRESTKAHSPRSIALYDWSGKQLWRKEHKLNWYIFNMTETPDSYVASGFYSEEVNTPNLGFVVSFDKQGGVNWTYKTTQPLSVAHAFPQADGDVVFIGSDYNMDGVYMAKAGPNGLAWERLHQYGTGTAPQTGRVVAAEQVGDTIYVASLMDGVHHSLRIMTLEGGETLTAQWDEPIPEVYSPLHAHFVPIAGELQLLVSGMTEKPDRNADISPAPYTYRLPLRGR